MKKRIMAILLAQALVISSVAPAYAADTSSGILADEILAGSAEADEYADESAAEEALEDIAFDDTAEWEIAEDGEAGPADEEILLDDEDNFEAVEETSEEASEDEEIVPADESTAVVPGDAEEIKEITDELKDKKEAADELELTPVVEDKLEAQEEILVGKPAASDVKECSDTDVYAQALCDMNIEYLGDFDEQIVLDLDAGTVKNDDGEELVGADSTVLTAMEETDAQAAADLLKEKGYANVTCENNVIKADDPYVTGRLYVMSSEPVDTRGALSVITFGETNLIQYASPAEAAIAYEMLKDDPGVWEILPDLVMKVEEPVSVDENPVYETPEAEETESEDAETADAGNEDAEITETEPADAEYEGAETSDAEYEDEEENYEDPVFDIESSGDPDDELSEEDEDVEFVRVEDGSGEKSDGAEADEAQDAESAVTEAQDAEAADLDIEDLSDFDDDVQTDEETVGKYFSGESGYLSKAVGYMRINKLLNNSGSVNNGVTVAVIDTGYDTSCYCVSYSRVLASKGVCLYGGSMHDANGHGTFVLNQIYEATNSSVKFIPINMYSDSGYSPLSMAESAIYKAVNLGANVINYSNGAETGFAETYSAGEAALQYALDHKCYLVASAGNDNRNAYYYWPANSDRCLTISAISYRTGYITSYSNYGSPVDFAAPGGDYGEYIYGYTTDNDYTGYAGTSQAAPYYTAIIANLKANGRSYSSLSALIKSLTNYCNSSLTSESSFYVGNGCVDLSKSINRSMTLNAYKDFGSRTYTGSPIYPNPTVRYNGTKLKRGRDYTITYANNINVGTARISVKGRGFYHGTATRYFKIVPRNIKKATVTTKSNSYSYTGSPRQPGVSVRLNGKLLRKGTDYTVSYVNNVGPGYATIVIKGRGNYTGTATGRFGIYKRVASVVSGYAYILVPKAATGRAVALKGGMVNNTRLFINTKTCSEAQQFKFTKNSDGTFTLRSVKCGLVIDSYNGKASTGAAGVIRNYSSSRKSQKWYVKKCKDGSFILQNKNSGKVLSYEKNGAKGAALSMHTRSNSTVQRFYLERVSNAPIKHAAEGVFSVRSAINTGYAMDVYGASTKSGAKLQIYQYNGSKAQMFRLIYSGDGSYRIVNLKSGKVLMPTGSKAKKGAAVVQGTWSGKTCQRWKLKKTSDGKIMFMNCAGYYLEVSSNTASNFTKLRLNSYAAAKRNRWVCRRIS